MLVKLMLLVNTLRCDRDNLKEILKNTSSNIAFSTDAWTAPNGKSYYGITGHFIDDDWDLQSMAIDFRPAEG